MIGEIEIPFDSHSFTQVSEITKKITWLPCDMWLAMTSCDKRLISDDGIVNR